MPRTTRTLALVPLVVAAVLSLPACSTVVPGTAYPLGAGPVPAAAAAPATTDDPVVWAGQVCAALAPLAEVGKGAHVDYSDPEKTRQDLDRLVEGLHTAAASSVDALEAIGPAPTPNGDRYVDQITSNLSALASASTDTDAALGSDGSSGGALGSLPDPDLELAGDPVLTAAFARSETCRQLNPAAQR